MKLTYPIIFFFCCFLSINAFSGINNPDIKKKIDNIFFDFMELTIRIHSDSFPDDLGIPENRKNEMINAGIGKIFRRETYVHELLKKKATKDLKYFTLAYAKKRKKEAADIIINSYEAGIIEEHLQPLSQVKFTSNEHKTNAKNLLHCAGYANEYWSNLEFIIQTKIQKENLSTVTWSSERGKERNKRIDGFINTICKGIKKIEKAIAPSDSSSCNNDTTSTHPPHSECGGSVTTFQNHTYDKAPSGTLPYPPEDSDSMPINQTKHHENPPSLLYPPICYLDHNPYQQNPSSLLYPPIGYLDHNPYQQNNHFITEGLMYSNNTFDTVTPSAPPLELID